MTQALRIILAAALLVPLIGCGYSESNKQVILPAPTVAAGPTLPPEMVLKEAPADAKDVSALKKDAKVGDEIVIRGQVGGSKSPIVDQRAILTIVDMKLPACNTKKDDDCQTPWDFCCETPETMKANTASIQFPGADGRPLKADLRSVSGLNNLAVVVVKGKVVSRDKDNLFINASGIFVEKKGMPAK